MRRHTPLSLFAVMLSTVLMMALTACGSQKGGNEENADSHTVTYTLDPVGNDVMPVDDPDIEAPGGITDAPVDAWPQEGGEEPLTTEVNLEPVAVELPEPATEVDPEPVTVEVPEPATEVDPEPVTVEVPEPAAEVDPEPIAEVDPEPIAEVDPEPTVLCVDDDAARWNHLVYWQPPHQRETGDVLFASEIKAYRLLYGRSPGRYFTDIVIDSSYNEHLLEGLKCDQYYVAITTIDKDNRESLFSDEIIISRP